jgi:hypothetical protein
LSLVSSLLSVKLLSAVVVLVAAFGIKLQFNSFLANSTVKLARFSIQWQEESYDTKLVSFRKKITWSMPSFVVAVIPNDHLTLANCYTCDSKNANVH